MKRMLAMFMAMLILILPMVGCADSAEFSYADTIAWNGEYDVVVVGFGSAGAVAASTAADEGAKVLLVEKAPEGNEGGNTRYCGQLFVYGGGDAETTYKYYQQLFRGFDVPDEMLRVYTTKIADMYNIMEDLLGIDQSNFVDWSNDPFIRTLSPEYPEFEGHETISLNTIQNTYFDGHFWRAIRTLVTDRADKIDVWFESPAEHLIQDPVTKTILGVQVARGGEMLNIRAKNGVILTCGGFENNQEMVETYLGLPRAAVCGSLYNTGDGVRMAMEVGADLWHMDVYEGAYSYGSFKVAEGERNSHVRGAAATQSGSIIFVGEDGSRYLREDENLLAGNRHGHMYYHGIYLNPTRPLKSFVVYDQKQADKIAEAKMIPEQYQNTVIKADTIEELAVATGMNPQTLAHTIEKYNMYAEQGEDYEFGRLPEHMEAFSAEGPYYAFETIPNIINTQGGPRRNENAEIVDVNGDPIPHLYSAGELGGITAQSYQGGGNISETIIFGQIAGKNAAAEKTEIASPALKAVESNITYVPGAMSDLVKADAEVALGENEYVGKSENGIGGTLTVKVALDNGKIVSVEIVEHHESKGIADPAIEKIPAAIVEANSTEVDTIASATITSKAIIEAVNNALAQVK